MYILCKVNVRTYVHVYKIRKLFICHVISISTELLSSMELLLNVWLQKYVP